MVCQMIRVISSPSSSTTELVTLIFAMKQTFAHAVEVRRGQPRRALLAESRPDGRRYSIGAGQNATVFPSRPGPAIRRWGHQEPFSLVEQCRAPAPTRPRPG